MKVEILRKACKANNLGASGTASVLLNRLISAAAKEPKKKKPAVKPPKKTKAVASKSSGGQTRLSAAYYFYEECGGVLSRCRPKRIRQPNGKFKLKEIRIVNGVHGRCPKWVLAK